MDCWRACDLCGVWSVWWEKGGGQVDLLLITPEPKVQLKQEGGFDSR